MDGDDRIRACRRARVMAVTAAPLTFEAAESGRLRRRALKAAQAEEDFYDMVPERQGDEICDWQQFLGVGLGELIWVEPDPADPTGKQVIARIRNGRNVPRLKVWNPRNVRKDSETGRWLVMTRDGTEVVATPGDGKWVILDLGGDRPWLKGPWRGVAPLWRVKQGAVNRWAEQGARVAGSMMWVTAPDGIEQDQRDAEALYINKALAVSSTVVAQNGYTAEPKEIKGIAWQTHQARWERCDIAISVAILYGDLSTESKASVGTGANLQEEMIVARDTADARAYETDFREQVLKPWALVNFGDAEVAPWPVRHVEPPEDVRSMVGMWLTTAQAMATARKSGIGVDFEEIRNKTGFPITTEIEPIPAPQAGPSGARASVSVSAREQPKDIAAEVESLAAGIGLRAALELAASMRGAPLSDSELRVLIRSLVTVAAREFAALFADRTEEREAAMRRALSSGRWQWARGWREAIGAKGLEEAA
jgi:hypothetical protein